uniref:(California timema) hypothetical protein n=1 Tax=Timema californicum TaxID=61474 RepID=A0A7R9JCL6_TIMCA|nr:unnamed protein product [Timema californicum]
MSRAARVLGESALLLLLFFVSPWDVRGAVANSTELKTAAGRNVTTVRLGGNNSTGGVQQMPCVNGSGCGSSTGPRVNPELEEIIRRVIADYERETAALNGSGVCGTESVPHTTTRVVHNDTVNGVFVDNEYVHKRVTRWDSKMRCLKKQFGSVFANRRRLLATAKKQAEYIVNKLHGIPWDSGDEDYSLLEFLISRATTRAETVYIKGEEKKKFLARYFPAPVVDLYNRGSSSLKILELGRIMCMAHSSVFNFCYASIVWGLRDWMIEDGHAHHKNCTENQPVVPFCTLEKFGGNCAVFNHTERQELGNYKSVISKFFSNMQPPQKISLSNHEISLRRMCGDSIVVSSEKQDARLKRVAYIASIWARLCEVWDLIDVAVDRRDMWSTLVVRYCNYLIDTHAVDVCDTLTESADVIDLKQPTVETHIRNMDLISSTYYTCQVIGLDYYMLDCELKTHLRDNTEQVTEYVTVPFCCQGYRKNPREAVNCVPTCPRSCLNGRCSGNNTCVCNPGFTPSGAICVPVCQGGCINGNCTAPGVCNCSPGLVLMCFIHPSGEGNALSPSAGKGCQHHLGEIIRTREVHKGYIKDALGKCIPTCKGGCVDADCTAPNTCSCHKGYSKRDRDPNSNVCVAQCTPRCLHGDCTGPNICTCRRGYVKDGKLAHRCTPKCSTPCVNGTCTTPDVCTCDKGYSPGANNHTCAPACLRGCVHGTCTAPNVCTCDNGYTKSHQNTSSNTCVPTCTGGCIDGDCTAMNVCTCHQGFRKDLTVLAGNKCIPDCHGGCKNGNCTSPNSCICHVGYKLNAKDECEPHCSERCLNGACTGPDVCSCNRGYVKDPTDLKGVRCSPKCDPSCVNGICSGPDLCLCNVGFIKDRSVRAGNKCIRRN